MSLWLLLLACDAGNFVEAEVTDVSTVVRLTFDAPSDARTWVTYTDPTGVASRAEAAPLEDGSWQALLFATPDTMVNYQVWVDGMVWSAGSTPTGSDTPDVDVEALQAGFAQSLFTSLQQDMDWTTVLLDERGNVRWHRQIEQDPDWGSISLRTREVPEGVWVSSFISNPDVAEVGLLELVAWDGTVIDRIEAPYHHHDFWVHEDGRVVWLAYDNYDLDGEKTTADSLWMRTPDGDTFELCKIRELLPNLEDGVEPGDVWTWANHIDFDGEAYWVSLNYLGIYLRILTDGSLAGIMGSRGDGDPPDWRADTEFKFQHGGNFSADGTFLVFDNEGGTEGMRALEYVLDQDSQEANMVWSYQGPPEWESPALGDAVRFDNGSTAISWGVFGALHQVSLEGELEAALELEAGGFVGFLTPTASR